MKEGWTILNFEDCIEKCKKTKQLKTSEYLAEGKYPIVSQESDLISGYTNMADYVNDFGKPIVVFGDHSRVVKYIDFAFAVGADGVKILIPINDFHPKFFYYYLRWHGVENLGYSRHYKLLKEINIPLPSLFEQQHIVEEFDLLSSIIEKKKAQLNELDNLVQSLFYEMFGDPIINEKRWVIRRMSDIGEITTGNTPSRAIKEYYCDNYIEWIKTDNILKDSLYASEAKEYLSELGASHGRLVKKGAILVACIAGSVESIGKACITNRKVAFNQQINAITPNSDINVLFLYHLIKYMGAYIQEKATTGMKHILTKSMMETLKLPIPPIDLQNQFAERVQVIEHQKELIKKSVKEVETLFNSRMDYYFN